MDFNRCVICGRPLPALQTAANREKRRLGACTTLACQIELDRREGRAVQTIEQRRLVTATKGA